MIRAYDDDGNVVELVEWENNIRADAKAQGYKEGRADAYIECIRIVSECVWKDSEMLEKIIAEQLKEQK